MLDEKKLYSLISSFMSEFLDSFKRKVYYSCVYKPSIDTYLCTLSDKPIEENSEHEEKFIIRGFDFATINKDKYEDMIFSKLEISFTNLGKKFSGEHNDAN